MPTAKIKPAIYQLKITLLEIDPPIWRRIQVPSTIALCCLHDALQAVLGWTASHLHRWEKDGLYWGAPDDDGFKGDVEVIDESKVPVSEGRSLASREAHLAGGSGPLRRLQEPGHILVPPWRALAGPYVCPV